MAVHRMTAVDAQFYWMSAKVPNDQFLVYAFDGEPGSLSRAIDEVRSRARACPDLTMRVRDGCVLTYPEWVPASDESAQVVVHELADASWDGCLDTVLGLADKQLDVSRMPWRLHVFTGVCGIPTGGLPGTVAVMQIGHALADGTRAAVLAGWLFGRAAPVPRVFPPSAGCLLPWRAVDAARTHRKLVSDIRDGRLVPPPKPRPPLSTNARPAGARRMRALVRHRGQLRGRTVTVSVLTAVSAALAEHLGGQADQLAAEVPIAKPWARQANNHFSNVTVGLYPQLSGKTREQQIAADLADGRRRAAHPAARAGDRAFAAVPAPLLRWGVTQFDADARLPQVSGNTAVSSVNRGPADLHFGGAPVLLTAGYPALSPVMGLTHGVHGIGETVVISVHAAESAIGDIDGYLHRLDVAL
jgi:hypothetical protein